MLVRWPARMPLSTTGFSAANDRRWRGPTSCRTGTQTSSEGQSDAGHEGMEYPACSGEGAPNIRHLPPAERPAGLPRLLLIVQEQGPDSDAQKAGEDRVGVRQARCIRRAQTPMGRRVNMLAASALAARPVETVATQPPSAVVIQCTARQRHALDHLWHGMFVHVRCDRPLARRHTQLKVWSQFGFGSVGAIGASQE